MSSIGALKPKETSDNSVETEQLFTAAECPVEKVTVYPDRAEVCRHVKGALVAGVNRIVITRLPETVDPDSVRVEGTGAATILEVVAYSEFVPRVECDLSKRERELIAEKELIYKWILDLKSEISVLKKQKRLLNDFANTASTRITAVTDKGFSAKDATLNKGFFKGMTGFLELYTKEADAVVKKQLELERQVDKLMKKFDATMKNLTNLKSEKMHTDELRKCVITVDCKHNCKVSLIVSYVARSASWKPSYDIRMFTAEELLKITYYGQIKQTTGEDWTDAKLFLSTAQPSFGGEAPELHTAELHLADPPAASPFTRFRSITKNYSLERCVAKGAPSVPERSISFVDNEVSPPPPVVVAKAMPVGTGMAATMFEIVHRSTIPSDNMPRKVTVGIVDIKPKITYTSIPKCVPHAFMLGKVTNSSPYTFLAGDTNIFQDHTFVGRASMKNVYPMEEFECSLGVDPAVKITYKPLKRYRASSGIISKVTSNTLEQVIEVKNTHNYDIEILVIDQLPRSADDRIKVHLTEPQIDHRHPEKTKEKVTLNKSNNLEWNLELKKQETKEITLKYTVDHPASLQIYTEEK